MKLLWMLAAMPKILCPARGLLVLAVVLLSACASAPRQDAGPARVNVDPEVRLAFDQAMLALNQGDYEKGVEILSGVISKSQQTAVPHVNLAIAQMRLGRLEDAETTLKEALEIEPQNPVANNELGLLYRETGRFEDARQVYEKILKTYPNFPAANKNLGILCDLYLRDYVCAYRAYEAYTAVVPEDEEAAIWLVDVKRRAGL